jgi:hypothetical protein
MWLGDSHFWFGLMIVRDEFFAREVPFESTIDRKLDFWKTHGLKIKLSYLSIPLSTTL